MPRLSFRWDDRVERFRSSDGRFCPIRLVEQEFEKVTDMASATMRGLTQDLIDEKISLASWQTAMEHEVKMVNWQGAVVARGGIRQMDQRTWGFTGSQIKQQYRWLSNFAEQIANGQQPLDGRALVRAEMYGQAGRSTYQGMRRFMAVNKGKTEERRVLGLAEHCHTNKLGLEGCAEIAARGWVPIGTLPRIGDSPCRTHCHCRFEFR